MNFPAQFFDTSTQVLSLVLAVAIVAEALRRVAWRQLGPVSANAWLGACVGVMVLWSLKGGLKEGLNFHLLGAATLTLMAGPWLALIGMAMVLLALSAYGHIEWMAWGVNFLVSSGVPIAGTTLGLRLTHRHLPANYFVYLFGNAFLAGGVSFCLASVCGMGVLALADAYPIGYLLEDILPFYLLLSWSEAFSTGLMLAVFVVYKPHWVATFDDARYLNDKPPR